MGSLRSAFDQTVKTTDLIKAADAALVDAGRVIADQIDNAVANLTGSDVTKALYLMPHLVNILKEMLATPAARAAAGLGDKETAGGKLASLQAARSKRSA